VVSGWARKHPGRHAHDDHQHEAHEKQMHVSGDEDPRRIAAEDELADDDPAPQQLGRRGRNTKLV